MSSHRIALGVLGLVLAGAGVAWLVSGERIRARATARRDVLRPAGEAAVGPLESATRAAQTPAHGREPVDPARKRGVDAGRASAADQVLATWAGTCSVYGTISAQDGSSLSGAHVEPCNREGESVRADVRSGRYSITDLVPGRWWIRVSRHGYRSNERVVDIERSEEAQRVDLVLEPSSFLAVNLVAPGGIAYAEAIGGSVPETGLELVAIATSDAPGQRLLLLGDRSDPPSVMREDWHELEDTFFGWLELVEEPPVFVSLLVGSRVLSTQRAPAGAEEVTFVIDPGEVLALAATLIARVIDPDGSPANASLTLGKPDGVAVLGDTDDRGIVELHGLVPTTYQLLVEVDRSFVLREEVELGPGVTDLGAIRLSRRLPFQGMVVDLHGSPITVEEDCSVIVHCELLGSDGAFLPSQTHTSRCIDPDGSFSLDLVPGRYAFRALGEKWISPIVLVDVEEAPPGDFRLHAFRPSHAILSLAGGDWKGSRFTVVDDQGNAPRTGLFKGTAPVRLALPPGSYRLRLTDNEGVPRLDMPFDLGAEPLVIDLNL